MPRSNKNLNPSEQMISCPSCGAEYPNDTKFCPVDGTALNVSASAKDALIGRVIAGKYRILEKLGGGGMGAVYRAEHSLMSRIVAVKVLRGHLTDNENSLKRFQHEARIACRLDHPNAVTTYDFGIDDDLPYLVMEFIKGRSLNQILKDEGPLPLDRALRVLRQICDALSQAHELGIIHRDLKPDNFMITEVLGKDEFVKVLDFGVAKMLQQDPTESLTVLTQAGTIFGSPQYMAPEQIESRELDPRTDVYALGVVFFEMLTGEVPYHGVGLDLLVKHLHEKPRSVRDTPYGKKIPPAVDDSIRKALAKKKEDRFESVDAFCQSVEAAADSSRTTLIRIPLAGMKSTITSMKQGVSRLGQTTKKALVFPFVTLGRLLKSAATGIASGLARIFSTIFTAVRNALSSLTKLVRGIFRLLLAVPIKLIAALKFLAIKIGGLLAASFGGLFGVVRGAGAILKKPKALGALGIGLIAFAIYYNRAEIGQIWQSTSPKAPTLVSEKKLNTDLAISMNQSAGQPSNKSAANSGSSTGSEPDLEKREDEKKAYKVLYPAYSTYIGGELVQILNVFSAVPAILYLLPAIPAHVAGRMKAGMVDSKSKLDDLEKVSKDPEMKQREENADQPTLADGQHLDTDNESNQPVHSE